MDVIILLKLLFAHIFSDFILQTDNISQNKRKEGWIKLQSLFFHSLIQAFVAYVFVAQWDNWIIPVVIFSTHFMMDYIKSTYMEERLKTFMIDQILHIMVIVALWLFLYNEAYFTLEWAANQINDLRFWYVMIAYLLILKPACIFLSLFIKRWTPENSASECLPNAGKSIGYLERILILTFLFTGHIEGVGFLLAAKSIFRFGELNKAKEIKITEYVLIGTFASFTVAILIGFLALKLMNAL